MKKEQFVKNENFLGSTEYRIKQVDKSNIYKIKCNDWDK